MESGSTQEEIAKVLEFNSFISSIEVINDHSQSMMGQFRKGIKGKKSIVGKFFSIFTSPQNSNLGCPKTYHINFQNTKNIENSNNHKSFDIINCILNNSSDNGKSEKEFNNRWKKVEGNFRENLKHLIESILEPENLVIKSISGKKVACAEFGDIFTNYLNKVTKISQL